MSRSFICLSLDNSEYIGEADTKNKKVSVRAGLVAVTKTTAKGRKTCMETGAEHAGAQVSVSFTVPSLFGDRVFNFTALDTTMLWAKHGNSQLCDIVKAIREANQLDTEIEVLSVTAA